MRIDGWAFKPNGDAISDERRKRYKELDHNDFKILDSKVGYARNTYTIEVSNDMLSPTDILIYADSGNTCFGGVVDFVRINDDGNRVFKVDVYTD